MRPGGGHSKGAGFERSICKKFSLWITDGERDDLFWRTAMSGGRATIQRRKGQINVSQVGDICAIDPLGNKLLDRAVVEAKFYRDLDLQGFIFTGTGKLTQFWGEALDEAKAAMKIPLLIAKQNRLDTLLITAGAGRELLNLRQVQSVCHCPQAYSAPSIFWFDSVLKTKCPL